MKIISFMILLSLLATSCSYLNYERMPASSAKIGEQSKEEILKVFEFQSSNLSKDTDYRKFIQDYVEKKLLFMGTYSTGNEIAVEFIEDESLPKNVAYFPKFDVENNKYKIIILHSKSAVNDPVASVELLNFIRSLREKKFFQSHFASFEMFYNAINSDAIALYNWAKVRDFALHMPMDIEYSNTEIDFELVNRAYDWAVQLETYNQMASKALRLQKKKDLERRSVIDALDKASDDLQFKNLVAKNDRKGVAELLKKYLPWEQMPPLEKRFWDTYLDVIVNPAPMEERIFLYRGLGDDIIYSAFENGEEIEKETAKKEGKVFVMSTIITKNQGTWNRRLRSLTTMYEKFIATDTNLQSEYTKSARMVTMFVNHSKDPNGSPFLSFTPKFSVAYSFGSNRMSAYALDPRLLSFNFASKFKNEVEFLLPLMAFPEDVVGYYDSEAHPDLFNSESLMKELFQQKLIKEHGKIEGEKIFDKVMANSKEFFESSLNRYTGKVTAAVAGPKEPGIYEKLLNNLFAKKEVAPKLEAAPLKGTGCMDIISNFWK